MSEIQRLGIKNGDFDCTFCDAVAEDRDHVIPVSYFAKGNRKNLDVVPSCKSCNARFKRVEDYVRLLLTAEKSNTHPDAHEISTGPSRRAFENYGYLQKAILPYMEMVQLQTSSGVMFPYPQLGICADKNKIDTFFEKVVRGAYFVERGERLPLDYKIHWHQIGYSPHSFVEIPVIAECLRQCPPHSKGNGLYQSRFALTEENPFISFWLFMFYEGAIFGAHTEPPEGMPKYIRFATAQSVSQ